MTEPIYIPEGPVVVISRTEYERLHVHEQVGSRQRIAALREDRDRQRNALARAVAERDRLREEVDRVCASHNGLNAELCNAVRERDKARSEYERLRGDIARVATERDRAVKERNTLHLERDNTHAMLDTARAERAFLFPLTKGTARDMAPSQLLIAIAKWLCE